MKMKLQLVYGKSMLLQIEIQIDNINESFQLPKGWMLKEKQIFGGKGTGKRMIKKIKKSGGIEEQDIPKTFTIQDWISRYATALKDQATKTALQNKK
ncbi:16834_t:CDS:2 [Funneliformis mosseae]|uniref:16834_t:CDS:1 n=1 Tax=Funneliformis mosseae TaxID=27381 RepID=A0A9N9A6K5_FUNMO|nr:16834_t:CDS:2 [Funneliformis mosseae]